MSVMSRYQARTVLFLLLFSFVGLLLISSTSRHYAIQTLSAGDRAYQFYDDFTPDPDKSTTAYKILMVMSFFFITRMQDRSFLEHHRAWVFGLYIIGAAIVLAWWPGALVVTIVLMLVAYPWRVPDLPKPTIRWAAAALFVFALILRLEKIPNVAHAPLQPDAKSYMELSQNMDHPYDTGRREPFPVYVNWVLSSIVQPPHDLSVQGYLPIRLLTVILSCTVTVLIYLFGVRYFSHQTGFLAALIAVGNKALIYRSLQGLRLEWVILFTLLAIGLTLRSSSPERKVGPGLALGFISGLLLLTRTSFLPFVAFLLAWGWWTKTKTLAQCVIAGAFCSLMVLPYYIHCWYEFGDPFYVSTFAAQWYYQASLGNLSVVLDERITMGELMFQKFPWYRSMGFTALGTLDTLFGRYALRFFYFPFSSALIGASLVGYALWTLQSGKRFYILLLLILLGPMAFILGLCLVSGRPDFDWRLLAHLFPWMAYASAEGLLFLTRQSRNQRGGSDN